MATSERQAHLDSTMPSRATKMAQTAGYFISFIALGLVTASLGPTITGLAARTNTVLSEISIVFMARSLGYLLGSFLGGRLYDRMPGHPVMAAMVVAMGVTMALMPVISLLWLLAFVCLITGVAEGTLDVGGNALLVWVHGAKVGPYMNALHFFFGVGAFVAPIVIAQVVQRTGDIGWAYWTLALLMLPSAVWFAPTPSPVPHREPEGVSGGRSKLALMALLVMFFFLYVGAEVSFGGWVFTYSIELGLADEAAAAYLTSAFWGALTLGRLLAIPIAVRFRPSAILLGDLVICLLSVVVVLVWPHSSAALWVTSLGLGLGLASIFPTLMSLAERRMTVTGKMTGWFLIGSSAGGMFLPWLIGQLFESVGPRVTIIAIGIDLALTVAIWAVLSRNGHGADPIVAGPAREP
jgi:MFS transporter, FHS family, Na+ dependent glucose transporter 1